MAFSQKQLSTLAAPIGAIAVLTQESMATYPAMLEFGGAILNQPADLAQFSWLGPFGWAVFGYGVFNASLCRTTGGKWVRLFAAACFLVASVAIAIGVFALRAAFRNLAVSETVDLSIFMTDVEAAKLPLMAGWTSVLIGAVLLVIASYSGSAENPSRADEIEVRRPARIESLLAFLCSFLMAVACFWGVNSMRKLTVVFEAANVEPSRIASSVNSLLGAEFLTAIAVAGCGIAALLMTRSSNSSTTAVVEVDD